MSTHSRIGIELPDTSVLSVYCHFDGYPEFNGKKLVEHFNSRDAASELIDGGDISSLWTNAGFNNEILPEVGPLYYSSRGEDLQPSHDDRVIFDTDGEEFSYIFTLNNEWICVSNHPYDADKNPEQVVIPA